MTFCNLIFQIEQDRLLPALDRDTADGIIESEHVVKANADNDLITATAIVDWIETLKGPPKSRFQCR